MPDPGRPKFNVGDLVWVTVNGLLQFKQPVRILSIHEHDDGSLWAFVEGAEAAVPLHCLTAASADAGAAHDVTERPGPANDEQHAYSPNAAAMRAHLEHLFGGYLDGYHEGLIELAWTDTRPGKDRRYALSHARMFGTDEIEELIAKAVQLNVQPMCNVYVGAALRKPDTPRDKRARDEHVLALTAAYNDLDKPGAVAAARKKYVHVRPTLTVITGRVPHERAQEWRRLTEPATDPAAWRALLEGMAHAMGGDSSVVNPSHVMRLAGSLAWPMKEGRKVEMTSIAPPGEGGQASYTFEHLSAVFPPLHSAGGSAATDDGVKRSKNAFGFDDRVEDGRERYMLKTICAVLIEIVGMTGAAPTAQELLDAAWPQYERCTDLSRAGRGRDEFAEKCAYTVKRFLAGKIGGCKTIEETIELYRRRQASAGQKQAGAGQAGKPPPEHDWDAEFNDPPADPVDLWAKFDPPPLPRGILPKVIEDFAIDRSTTMGCDVSGIAVGALVVCAASIPEDIKLQPKRHDTEWREAARLWGALVGSVSGMKSPMLDAIAKEVRRIDTAMARAYQEALSEWLRLPKEKQRKTSRPKQLRARIMNTTVEASQEILRDSPNGVLLDQDELSGWFGSMDKYSGSRGAQADRAFWLQAYNGGAYTVDRVTRGTVFIPHLSVSILGFIQPEPIRKLADGGEDDGLLQRFIPIILRPAVSGRDEAPGQAVFDYADLVASLRELKPPKTGILIPADASLTFDDGALRIREKLEKRHLELVKLKSLNRKLTSHFGKYNGIFARLCVIWHCVEHVNEDELPPAVTEDTARRVASFLHGFLLKHALSFYVSVLGLANDHDRLANVADYILAHRLARITNRDVQRGDRSMRGLKRYETEAIFEQLEALGWVTRVPGPRLSDPPHWVVNSAVHQKFAERAEAEKKRRREEREMIADLLNR